MDPESTTEPLSKKALKKMEKEKEKEALKATKAQQHSQSQQAQTSEDFSTEFYGELSSWPTFPSSDRKWTEFKDLGEAVVGQEVLVRGRLSNSRVKGNLAFLVLRDNYLSVQCVGAKSEKISKQMINFIKSIQNESIVEISATVVAPQVPIESCTQKVELQIQTCFVVNRSQSLLPFQIQDASAKVDKATLLIAEEEKKEDDTGITVHLKTRLDNRVLDLRTPAKQAIFRLQSGLCQVFREFCYQNDFVEIHTPKLIGGTSEGGSNVFKLDYFGKPACLAQSPQLYKQMAVMSDFQRVFEIGPVFRAENSHTHRHLCEFTGMDLEMVIKENYHELMDTFANMFAYIFKNLESRFQNELKAINEQFPFEPFRFVEPVPKLTFEEGVKLLNENGVEWDVMEDLSTEVERKLGHIVREKYGTDLYFLHRYPKTARPFYTMPCPDNNDFTCSYDFFMRGEEITSGAQRIHDPVLLAKRAQECGIEVSTIKDYIDSFNYGAYPHGGCGIGMERMVFLYCDLKNIRNSTMFPRDPKRLTP